MPKKKNTKMVILGARDCNGKKIDLKNLNNLGEKKILALHYHPDVVVRNFDEILADYKEADVPKPLYFLFEDACAMLKWAARRMNVMPPKKEDSAKENEDTPQN